MRYKKTVVYLVISIIVISISIYYLTPQSEWVPQPLKKIVHSCYRENSSIPIISSKPECCYGLHKQSYPDINGSPVIGAGVCKK